MKTIEPTDPGGPDADADLRLGRRRRRPGVVRQAGPAVRRPPLLRRRLERARVHEDQRHRQPTAASCAACRAPRAPAATGARRTPTTWCSTCVSTGRKASGSPTSASPTSRTGPPRTPRCASPRNRPSTWSRCSGRRCAAVGWAPGWSAATRSAGSTRRPYSAAIEADPVADRYVSHPHRAHLRQPARHAAADRRPDVDDGVEPERQHLERGLGRRQRLGRHHHRREHPPVVRRRRRPTRTSTGSARRWAPPAGSSRSPNGGDGYRVSKRLWAFAAYSRFIRPGAVRVPATFDDPNVKVTAFRNRDGSMVVELLNTGTANVSTSFTHRHAGSTAPRRT